MDEISLINSRIPDYGGMTIALYTAINVTILYYSCNAHTKCDGYGTRKHKIILAPI